MHRLDILSLADQLIEAADIEAMLKRARAAREPDLRVADLAAVASGLVRANRRAEAELVTQEAIAAAQIEPSADKRAYYLYELIERLASVGETQAAIDVAAVARSITNGMISVVIGLAISGRTAEAESLVTLFPDAKSRARASAHLAKAQKRREDFLVQMPELIQKVERSTDKTQMVLDMAIIARGLP